MKKCEEKYDLNLWQIAINERIFQDYNPFYRFSRNEILSILDELGVKTSFLDDEIRLNETIFFIDETYGTFGKGLIQISESISFEEKISTEVYRPQNIMIDVSEFVELPKYWTP